MRVFVTWSLSQHPKSGVDVIKEIMSAVEGPHVAAAQLAVDFQLHASYVRDCSVQDVAFEALTLDHDALVLIYTVHGIVGIRDIGSHIYIQPEGGGSGLPLLEFASHMCKRHWNLREAARSAVKRLQGLKSWIKDDRIQGIRRDLARATDDYAVRLDEANEVVAQSVERMSRDLSPALKESLDREGVTLVGGGATGALAELIADRTRLPVRLHEPGSPELFRGTRSGFVTKVEPGS